MDSFLMRTRLEPARLPLRPGWTTKSEQVGTVSIAGSSIRMTRGRIETSGPKHRYVRMKDKHDPRDHHYTLHLQAAGIPIPRKVDLRPGCSPVVDQGELGSCTGHAVTGALEFEENAQKEQFARLSRLFVYYNERMIEGDVGQDVGAEIRDGIKSIVKWGAATESLWPSDEKQFAVKPLLEAYNDALNHKALQYQSVAQTLDAITHCLAVFNRPRVSRWSRGAVCRLRHGHAGVYLPQLL